jgi:hypothetical protein
MPSGAGLAGVKNKGRPRGLRNRNVNGKGTQDVCENAMSNVVHLPRPKALRPSAARAGYYLRVGRNDHREVADLLAEGVRTHLGLIVEAPYADRHKELLAAASAKGLDTILDTKSQQAAFRGSYNDAIGSLPWGLGRQAGIADYAGVCGFKRAEEIATFVREKGFSAVIAPTHLLAGPTDPWLDVDIRVANKLRELLPPESAVFYSLAIPIAALRHRSCRTKLVLALSKLEADAIWLKVENFGSDSSGEKVGALIEALADLQDLGIPIIADHVAGLPGLSLIAFGAVGGLAHGVMVFEGFKASSWRTPSTGQPFSQGRRIYLHELDLLVKPLQAEALMNRSTRIRGQHSCRDARCCPNGYADMKTHPVRHYLRQRAKEFEAVNAFPSTIRISEFMEKLVRPRSDAMSALAAAGLTDNVLNAKIQKRHIALGRFRGAMSDLARSYQEPLLPELPKSKEDRMT